MLNYITSHVQRATEPKCFPTVPLKYWSFGQVSFNPPVPKGQVLLTSPSRPRHLSTYRLTSQGPPSPLQKWKSHLGQPPLQKSLWRPPDSTLLSLLAGPDTEVVHIWCDKFSEKSHVWARITNSTERVSEKGHFCEAINRSIGRSTVLENLLLLQNWGQPAVLRYIWKGQMPEPDSISFTLEYKGAPCSPTTQLANAGTSGVNAGGFLPNFSLTSPKRWLWW